MRKFTVIEIGLAVANQMYSNINIYYFLKGIGFERWILEESLTYMDWHVYPHFLGHGIEKVKDMIFKAQGLVPSLSNAFPNVSQLAILVARTCNIYPLSFLLNLGQKQKVPWNFQHMVMFSAMWTTCSISAAVLSHVTMWKTTRTCSDILGKHNYYLPQHTQHHADTP